MVFYGFPAPVCILIKNINLIETADRANEYPDGWFKNHENIMCFLLYKFHKTAKVTC